MTNSVHRDSGVGGFSSAPASSPVGVAIEVAAAATAERIADGTRRMPGDVRAQLDDAVRWFHSALANDKHTAEADPPPVIARDYADILRTYFLAELEIPPGYDGVEVLRALRLLDELAQAWRRTGRGRFMARLSGVDGADAVVAVAHDVRSPLSSILILVDSLRRSRAAAANPLQDRQLALISGAAHELSSLVSDLIDAARGERLVAGSAAPCSVTEIMTAVHRIVLPSSEEKGIPIQLQPPKVDARLGHAAALHRVLLNLTSNALRYTDTGAVSVGCAEITTTDLEFWVSDTGRGVSPEDLESLTEGFRPERLSLRFSSGGLGLAIVSTLLDAMESTLRVDSRLERGTRFSFRLSMPPVR